MTALTELLQRPVLDVARGLLGARLRSKIGGTVTEVVVTEVEAYDGGNDPASHAYRGETPRNHSMFQRAGTLYVYRSYGIHWCMNVVVGPKGDPAAVLLRGGTAVVGASTMARRRGRQDHLTDGPGKLCQALGVTGAVDGSYLLGRGPLRLLRGEAAPAFAATPRVGITKAVDRPWRFVASS